MPSEKTIPLTIATCLTVGGLLVGAGISWGDMAKKTDLDALKGRVNEVETNHKLLSQKLDYVIKDTTDANSKLDFIIKEILRVRSGDQQPPSATPSPLNR